MMQYDETNKHNWLWKISVNEPHLIILAYVHNTSLTIKITTQNIKMPKKNILMTATNFPHMFFYSYFDIFPRFPL